LIEKNRPKNAALPVINSTQSSYLLICIWMFSLFKKGSRRH